MTETSKKPSGNIFGPTDWKKSSRSASSSECVEVARSGEYFGVRDSKNPRRGVLVFTKAEWSAFISGVEAGEFGVL